YLYSEEVKEFDFYHTFLLQLWRRRDVNTGSTVPGELTYFTLGKDQPLFSISNLIHQYFYESSDLEFVSRKSVPADTLEAGTERTLEIVGRLAGNAANSNKIVHKKKHEPLPEEEAIIDQLLEDVLPHGYTET
ncbi:MAG: hypothetical protein AB2687_21300, partial [Candidatus Thiodiazotropha taylori]